MITASFLHDVAAYTDEQINKVVLNDSYEITNFSVRQVDNQTVILQYTVPFDSVSVIERIELRTADDQIISTNDVYVPITAEAIISQTIHVKEAAG